MATTPAELAETTADRIRCAGRCERLMLPEELTDGLCGHCQQAAFATRHEERLDRRAAERKAAIARDPFAGLDRQPPRGW